MRSVGDVNVRRLRTNACLRALLLVMAVHCAACGSAPTAPTPTTPTPPAPVPPVSLEVLVVGNWVGTVTHPQLGSGTVALTIAAPSGVLLIHHGTWRMEFTNPAYRREGELDLYTEQGATAYGALHSGIEAPQPLCFDSSLSFTLQPVGQRLVGAVVFGVCSLFVVGDITLQRQ